MRLQWHWTRRKFRGRCEVCGTITHWFFVARLREREETPSTWIAWWAGQHFQTVHA